MAEKILQTRIINKHADLSTWNSSNLVLKTGEIALARVETTKPDGHGGSYTVPTYLMKVGDSEKTFSQLEWLAAPASDVYAWAKASTKPGYNAGEITRGSSNVNADLTTIESNIQKLQTAVGSNGSVAEAIKAAIEALDENTWSAEDGIKFVTAIGETDGKISVTRRALTAADIPELAQSKITGLVATLNAINTKFNDYRTATAQDTIDNGIKARVATIESDYLKAADIANFETKANVATVATNLANYISSNNTALASVKATAEAARTESEVNSQIDTKISALNLATTYEPIGAETKAKNYADAAIATSAASLQANINTKVAQSAYDTKVKALEDADSALDGRLDDVEAKLANVTNVMDFRGAVEALPAVSGYQDGDVIVVTKGTDAGKEFVLSGGAWVEFGSTSAADTAIASLQTRVSTAEGKIATIEAKPAYGITSTQISNWNNEVGAKALAGQKTTTAEVKTQIEAYGYAVATTVTAELNKKLDSATFETFKSTNTAAIATAKQEAIASANAAVATVVAAAATAQKAIDDHKADKNNPHGVTATQIGLGNVDNKSVSTIKTEFTGAISSTSTGFAVGKDVHSAIATAKSEAISAAASTAQSKVDALANGAVATNAANIKAIADNYVKITGNNLVDQAGYVIIFDCGGAE